MDNKEALAYWIKERYEIYLKRREGNPKPWSTDPIFQQTYFCNVRREDDRVTKFIRDFYSPHVEDQMFEYNIILSRFLNWPDTLAHIGYQDDHMPRRLNAQLRDLSAKGKVWGGAYVITTHGIKMDKLDYLTDMVLNYAYESRKTFYIQRKVDLHWLKNWKLILEAMEGIGPFLTGQVIADLKNTKGHPCNKSEDWWDFVIHGPGSLRGVNWFHHDDPQGPITANTFLPSFFDVREWIDDHWPDHVPRVCNQDLQNCLCEYDKYLRVKNGTGRSKRKYDGAV